ncbi:MAG: InlB B-repeat-containing protein [Clostridia bacterium]|nr:InlB B-repeat-containing protein [Clostridia bacterium]
MKKLIMLLLVLVMVPLSLFACGEDEPTGDGTYNIKFMVDGVEVASVKTDGKSEVTLPTDPFKSGYTFDGWFWDSGVWKKPFTKDYFIETPFTSSIDVKVYAKFTYNGSDSPIPPVGGEGGYYDPDGWTQPDK